MLHEELKGEPVTTIPEGYEIYESPEDSQVFLRKMRPRSITELEEQTVINALRNQPHLSHFTVDVENDSIVVYLPGTNATEAQKMVEDMMLFGTPQRMKEKTDWLIMQSHYHKCMRFVLDDIKKRTFTVERWCFLGSIDDWHLLEGEKPLTVLVMKYAKHLGKESRIGCHSRGPRRQPHRR